MELKNYTDDLSLLISQYQNSEKLKSLIESGQLSTNDIDKALFEIGEEIYLFNAVGVQLDVIGEIFDEQRQGRTDVLYRQAIQEKAVLSYSGEPESIIEIVQAVFGATYVYYRPAYPGKYYLLTDGNIRSVDLDPVNPVGVSALIESFLIDTEGNYILDVDDNKITVVIELETFFLLDGDNNYLLDYDRNILASIA